MHFDIFVCCFNINHLFSNMNIFNVIALKRHPKNVISFLFVFVWVIRYHGVQFCICPFSCTHGYAGFCVASCSQIFVIVFLLSGILIYAFYLISLFSFIHTIKQFTHISRIPIVHNGFNLFIEFILLMVGFNLKHRRVFATKLIITCFE